MPKNERKLSTLLLARHTPEWQLVAIAELHGGRLRS